MYINIIFSFRNEEKNLRELVFRIGKVFEKISDVRYKIIFVNDFSIDDSLSILLNLKETYPIKIINTSRRFGYSAGVLAGLKNVDSNADAIIYMDADLQDPPELIPKLLQEFRNGHDVVHTQRTIRRNMNYFHRVLTKYAYRFITLFSDIKLPLDSGDFKLLSYRVVKEVLKIKEFDPYIRGLSVWVGFQQTSISYVREGRYGGVSNFPMFGSSGPYKEFIRGITSHSVAPLYFAVYIGILAMILSIITFIYALYTKINGSAIPGSSGALIVISFFSGVILFTNGVIGIYLGRIYNAVKGRPNYIIDNILD